MSISGIPCNPCSNGICGNCVGDKMKLLGFIRDAKDHCLCASKGHSNQKVGNRPNKTMFGSKKDTEYSTHPNVIQENSDDEYVGDE